jgi:hypothetical protein
VSENRTPKYQKGNRLRNDSGNYVITIEGITKISRWDVTYEITVSDDYMIHGLEESHIDEYYTLLKEGDEE